MLIFSFEWNIFFKKFLHLLVVTLYLLNVFDKTSGYYLDLVFIWLELLKIFPMICIRRVCFIIFCICTFLPFSNFAAAPVNDNCTIATTISDVTNNCFAIDMNNATFDIANGNCALNPTDVNIWYSFSIFLCLYLVRR